MSFVPEQDFSCHGKASHRRGVPLALMTFPSEDACSCSRAHVKREFRHEKLAASLISMILLGTVPFTGQR
jgi:hypothetical protein